MSPANAHGILLLDKPPGESSFAALYPVKRAFGGKKGAKVGHAGTLDPAASGLLIVGVGAGTRLLEFLEAMPKSYRFRLHLGIETDSYDLEGEVLARKDASHVTREALEALLPEFIGSIAQMPPAYSAIKIDGKRAYERARDGETVTMSPRNVRIDRLEILSFDASDAANVTAVIEMDCSKGTYVRSLAHDVGQRLGCGGAADQIRRLAIGPFRVERAISPEAAGPEALLPLEAAIADLPVLRIADAGRPGLRNGNPLPAALYTVEKPPVTDDAETEYAVFSQRGTLLCTATRDAGGRLCPRKVFPAALEPASATP